MSRFAAVLLGSVVLLFAAGPLWGQVLINEVMADPASDWSGDSTYSYKEDEWVEIYNSGDEVVNLASFWLGDSDSTLLYNFSGGLGARRHRVVYGAEVTVWQEANGVATVGLRLNNSGDTVMLWRMPGDSTGAAPVGQVGASRSEPVLEDRYTYVSHEGEDDRSTGLMPDGGPSRMLFDGLNPYTGAQEPQGEGCLPSPGGRNSCPTPVEQRSWGSVKAVYK
jgi:hypothetical protein